MSKRITFDELIDVSQFDHAALLGFHRMLRPLAWEKRFTNILREFCCACCRANQALLADDSLAALRLIEAFNCGDAGGEALTVARKLARNTARRVARQTKGKTKEYWACHAVCEAARNNVLEALVWNSWATDLAGLRLDRKLTLFREVLKTCRLPSADSGSGL
jgi:hypothetical protein